MSMSKKQSDIWKEKLLIALEKSLGIVTPACKEVGLSRETFYRYYREDEEFKRKVDDINDFQLDFVENQLFNKIKSGSERSIMFYMKYKGKKRGYTDSVDITTGGKELKTGDIKIIYVDGDKRDDSSEEDGGI